MVLDPDPLGYGTVVSQPGLHLLGKGTPSHIWFNNIQQCGTKLPSTWKGTAGDNMCNLLWTFSHLTPSLLSVYTMLSPFTLHLNFILFVIISHIVLSWHVSTVRISSLFTIICLSPRIWVSVLTDLKTCTRWSVLSGVNGYLWKVDLMRVNRYWIYSWHRLWYMF